MDCGLVRPPTRDVYKRQITERLQLAAPAALAGEALPVMHREQQLQCELAGFLHLRCIGEYFHPLVDRINACLLYTSRRV